MNEPTEDDMSRDLVADLEIALRYQANPVHGRLTAGWAVAIRRAIAAERVAAARVSGDPEVRDLLLYEFGTTEPALLREAIADLRERQGK